jgi:hypothetical protein
MRIIVPIALVAAAFAALSSFAFARGSKPVDSCSAAPVVEQVAESCTVSERLCENWLKGRATYRATFPNSGRTCG